MFPPRFCVIGVQRAGCASGVEAAQIARLQDARAGHDVGGRAQRDFVLLGHVPHAGEGFFHDAHQAFIDFGFRPEEAGEVLHPFKVADRDSACIGNDVGHDKQ